MHHIVALQLTAQAPGMQRTVVGQVLRQGPNLYTLLLQLFPEESVGGLQGQYRHLMACLLHAFGQIDGHTLCTTRKQRIDYV